MGLRAGVFAGVAAVLLAGAVLAEGPVDPRVLEMRLNPPKDPATAPAGATKRLTLEGCALRIERTGTMPGDWSRSDVLWLGDLQTDPEKNIRRGDMEPRGGAVGVNGPEEYAIYYWRMESLIAFENDINRWTREHERIMGLAVVAGDDSSPQEQRAETRRVRSAGMRALHEAALAGAYGPMLQRNQIASDGVAVEFGTNIRFFSLDLMFPRFWYKSETAESPLVLSMPKAEAEAVVNDLHRYARQVCP